MKSYSNLNEDPMVTYCRMAIETKYEDLPPEVVKFAKHMILDTIGNMVGGSGFDGIPEVVAMVKEKGGKPDSYIPFYGGKVPASEAGMAIGPMPRAIDWAAIHPEAMHSTEHNLPGLLACLGLKEKVSGKDFITAFAMAQEVSVRIGCAFRGNMGITMGRSNGHYIFGVVIGVGKLLGLTQEQMENAFGISRSMTQPHDMAAFHPPTHMIKIHHGFIAQDAVNCCDLARRGITGPRQNVLLEPKGFLGFAKWETHPQLLTTGLGEKWEQFNAELKHFLGCKCGHTAMLGVLKLMKEHNFTPDDIQNIDILESPLNMSVMSGPDEEKFNPKNMYDCQFSVPYLVASIAYDKEPNLAFYFDESRTRPHVHALMQKIQVSEDTSLPEWAATNKVTLKNGKTHTCTTYVEELKGSAKNPYTEAELIKKFKAVVPYCVMKMEEAKVDKLLNTLLHLEDVQDVVEEVVKLLTPDC